MLPDRTLSGIPLVGVGEGKCGVCSRPVGCGRRGKPHHLPLVLGDKMLTGTERASFTAVAKDGISKDMFYFEGKKRVIVSDILLEHMLVGVEPSPKAAFLENLRKWLTAKNKNRDAAQRAERESAAAAEEEEEEGAG